MQPFHRFQCPERPYFTIIDSVTVDLTESEIGLWCVHFESHIVYPTNANDTSYNPHESLRTLDSNLFRVIMATDITVGSVQKVDNVSCPLSAVPQPFPACELIVMHLSQVVT